MTKKEKLALFRAGVVIGKITYNDVTKVLLLPQFLFRFKIQSFPDVKTFDQIFNKTASNTTVFAYRGKDIGLYLRDDAQILSYSLRHPLAKYWESVLKPVWAEQLKGKCPTCHGTGWDGIGYTLTCVDCGGTGKK